MNVSISKEELALRHLKQGSLKIMFSGARGTRIQLTGIWIRTSVFQTLTEHLLVYLTMNWLG